MPLRNFELWKMCIASEDVEIQRYSEKERGLIFLRNGTKISCVTAATLMPTYCTRLGSHLFVVPGVLALTTTKQDTCQSSARPRTSNSNPAPKSLVNIFYLPKFCRLQGIETIFKKPTRPGGNTSKRGRVSRTNPLLCIAADDSPQKGG